MAQEENQKKKKKKKSTRNMLIAILVPIIIIVMLGSFILAIIDALLGWLIDMIVAIVEFCKEYFTGHVIKDIERLVKESWSLVENSWNKLFGVGKFNEKMFEKYRNYPAMVIDKQLFEETKQKIQENIGQNVTGLDDLTLKKLILVHNKISYLSDVQLLMEVTEEERKDSRIYPFTVISGNAKKGWGENGKYYLKTNGSISIKKGDTNLFCYSAEGITKILNKEYKKHQDDDYGESVKEFLKKCYTYNDAGEMQVLAFNEDEESESWLDPHSHPVDLWLYKNVPENDPIKFVTVDYQPDVEKYKMPLELLVEFMEITGSRDFIDTVIELVDQEQQIELELCEVGNEEDEYIVQKYVQNVEMLGKTDNIEYIVKNRQGEVLEHTEEPIENLNHVNITVTAQTEGEVALFKRTTVDMPVEPVQNNQIVYRTLQKQGDSYTWTWENQPQIPQQEKTLNDSRSIEYMYARNYSEKKYEVAVKKVKTWFATCIMEGGQVNRVATTFVENENGEMVETEDDRVSYLKKNDEKEVYTKEKDQSWILDIFWKNQRLFGRYVDAFSNDMIEQSVAQEEYSPKDYHFDQFTIERKGIEERHTYTKTKTTLVPGVEKWEDKTSLFLGLLSNSTGEIKIGAQFKSKKDGGKVVQYPDLYGSTVGVGDLLENGASVLFELLDKAEDTQILKDTLKYIFYMYSNKQIDYGVREPSFSEYSVEQMMDANIDNVSTPLWWPLGSQEIENKGGILFASGNPIEGASWEKRNRGIEITGKFDVPGPYIIASAPGIVEYASPDGGIYETGEEGSKDGGGYGNFIIINHQNGYKTYYAHLYKGSITVEKGDKVEAGQVLGQMGKSGNSSKVNLYFEVRFNSRKQETENLVSMEHPRPQFMGVISQELYQFITTFEGGTQYYNSSTEEYEVFNNGLDNNLELTGGIAIGTQTSGLYSYVKEILGRDVKIGDTITKEEYETIYAHVAQEKLNIVNEAIVSCGVTLTQNQKDAVYSLCYNVAGAETKIKEALLQYMQNKSKGYWGYIHTITNNGLAGLVRRRGEEMQMFQEDDYQIGSVEEGLNLHQYYNRQYGLPEGEGA